jgi:D-aminopeptidase
MNPLFVATAEAVEEAIVNAVVAAETMTGWQDRTAHSLPHDELQRIMADQHWHDGPRQYSRGPYHQ